MRVRIKDMCGYQIESNVGDIVEARPCDSSMELNVKVSKDYWMWLWFPITAYENASLEDGFDYFLKQQSINVDSDFDPVSPQYKYCAYIKQLNQDVERIISDKKDAHYDNTNGSLYKFAEDHGLNAYEFDIIKRVVRCRKKCQFKEDLEKTKRVIDLYLKEFEL